MAIHLDTAKARRTPGALRELVQAVVQSGSADEAAWIECKSDLDLRSNAEDQFTLAKTILSFANRMPDLAKTRCEGLAYIIVGAEPGKVTGTQIIDAADLEKFLVKYLGADGPDWSPTYLTVDSQDVLVITVEAPKWGDPIQTLRKGGKSHQEGVIFFRAQSNSAPAKAGQVRMLEERLLRGSPEIEGLGVSYTFPNNDQGLPVVDPTSSQIDVWQAQRRALLTEKLAGDPATQTPQLRALVDRRITEHLDECLDVLVHATERHLVKSGKGLIELSVRNPGRRHLNSVELTLSFPVACDAAQAEHWRSIAGLPASPPKVTLRDLLLGDEDVRTHQRMIQEAVESSFATSEMATSSVSSAGNSVLIDIGDIRPEGVATASIHVILREQSPDVIIHVPWTLTSTSMDGVQHGNLTMPVQPGRLLLRPSSGLP